MHSFSQHLLRHKKRTTMDFLRERLLSSRFLRICTARNKYFPRATKLLSSERERERERDPGSQKQRWRQIDIRTETKTRKRGLYISSTTPVRKLLMVFKPWVSFLHLTMPQSPLSVKANDARQSLSDCFVFIYSFTHRMSAIVRTVTGEKRDWSEIKSNTF